MEPQQVPLEVVGDASVKGEREKRIVALNAATFVVVLALNGLAGSGKLTGTSIGAVSNDFPTYITPAGYAFSIWGVIYTCMSLTHIQSFVCVHIGVPGRRGWAQKGGGSASAY